MPFKFSNSSERELGGVHPDLVRVMRRAINESPIDFRVMEGLRSLAQQKVNVEKGVSKTLKSKHLTGHAVDVVPLIDGEVSWAWPVYHKLAPVIKAAARKEGVSVTWGGDWRSFKDGPHWELDPRKYPMPS